MTIALGGIGRKYRKQGPGDLLGRSPAIKSVLRA
jgi:hypothetical protein